MLRKKYSESAKAPPEPNWENVFAILAFYEDREHDHNHVYNIQAARGFLEAEKARLAVRGQEMLESADAEVLEVVRIATEQRARAEKAESETKALRKALTESDYWLDVLRRLGYAVESQQDRNRAALATPAEETTK